MKITQGWGSNKLLTTIGWLLLIANFFTSCAPRIAYFKDLPRDTLKTPRIFTLNAFSSPTVKTDDILNITIETIDPTSNRLLNEGNQPILAGAASNSNGVEAAIQGYLVNKDGYIKMPYLDTVYVRGMTTDQITDTLVRRIGFYFKDPVVNVRFANFRVTVLGQVKNPASFIMPNEKPTIFDAIGLAGDITIYGKMSNVLLMRDDDFGKKEVVRINLDSSSALMSKYFYLRPNDVIYVEPTNSLVQKSYSYTDTYIRVAEAVLVLIVVIYSHRSP